jgi:hypothetical protein
MSYWFSSEISFEDYNDLLEKSQIVNTIDLGSALIHNVIHPIDGRMALVNTVCGRSAIIR